MLGSIVVFLRNLVLATVMAWLGMEFAPADKDDSPKADPVEKALVLSISK